jgi:aminopeptidase YwaD
VKRLFFLLSLSIFLQTVYGQWQPDKHHVSGIRDRLYNTVLHLVADSLEGREAGTRGEIIARDYIAAHFAELGLEPFYPDGSYFRAFEILSDHIVSEGTAIYAGQKEFLLHRDFIIVSHAYENKIHSNLVSVGNGLVIPEKNVNDYSGFTKRDLNNNVFIIDISFPEEYPFSGNDHYKAEIQEIINTAIENNASAIILFQSNNQMFPHGSEMFFNNSRSDVPVIFAEHEMIRFLKENNITDLKIDIVTTRETIHAYNVAAVINNHASQTIVTGAHYDHLGWGSPISRHKGLPAIHSGADDNASGVAVMLEVARHVATSGLADKNFVFVAFGAEEKGLIGSKVFVEDTLLPVSEISAMINLDMVGRLNPEERKINVHSTGTSLIWDSLLTISYNPMINLNKNPAVTGGSDHAPFANNRIPVLFFITGLHSDYHTPDDVIEKINFDGMADITVFVSNLMHHLNHVPKVPFNEQKGSESTSRPSHARGVSLGITPDHAFTGKGLRVENVSSGKTAETAGILSGDIIIGIDQYEVNDITSYMRALSNYKTGSGAKVKILRNTEEMTLDVKF